MKKPIICGDNKIYVPESGCGDCAELDYRISQLEDWKDEFVAEGYNALANKPSINGVTVEGNKDSEDYLIAAISDVVTYSLESDGNTITLVGSDGSRTTVSITATASCDD